MATQTAFAEYMAAALAGARYELLEEEGVIGATIPGCAGVIAFGFTREECSNELQRRLSDWINVGLRRGIDLPTLNGVRLDPASADDLPVVDEGLSDGQFYADDEALEAAFAEMDKRALADAHGSS